MHADNALVTFAQEGPRVRAWISASSVQPAASAQDHRYAALTAALRQRGLECTVDYGLSDYIVNADLSDGSSLIISPPQETPSDHPAPESWIVTRHGSGERAVYEVIYNSDPGGPHAQHGGSVPHLLAAVDTRLDQLGVPSREEHQPSAQEHAAVTVLSRTGFIAAKAADGKDFYRLPATLTDPAEQRRLVTRAVDMLRAEGFHLGGDPALVNSSSPTAPTREVSLGDRPRHLAGSVGESARGRSISSLNELTAPGSGVLQRVVQILDTTAGRLEEFGDAADRRHANGLRRIAGDMESSTVELQAIHDDLTDRHIKAPARADRTVASAPAEPRRSAALASSPSAGHLSVPAGPPAEASARTATPPARPSSGPGR